jgi:undecaprenyl diphosphate synthase
MATEAPLHIAIIPDGNRRWAKRQALMPWQGHKKAIDNFHTLTEWCHTNPDIGTLTVWCFSTENWKRDEKEISRLMDMLEDYLKKERDELQKKNIRFAHSGRTDRIPHSLSSLMKEIEEETAKNTDFTLHLAVDYGGKDEIVRAIKRIEKGEISEESVREKLDHPEISDIDLVIRTSGENRTSNFCLWQSSYAEWKFTEKLFPDFTVKDLEVAVEDFTKRSRRFGA